VARIEATINGTAQMELEPLVRGSGNLSEAFRRLYYQLYTNSKASRAERILEELSLLLLLKLATEHNGGRQVVSRFLDGEGQANALLLPVLRRAYPRLIDGQQRFGLGDEALRGALREIDAVSLSSASAHVLGDAFQALIGPRLRGDKGQFFTPRSVVKAMVEIADPKPSEAVLDPACGTGGFLLEAHVYQARHGQPTGALVGSDKDHDLYRLCSALLQIATKGRAELFNFNSLEAASWRSVGPSEGFDVVLTNPPFGARIGVRDPALLKEFALGHQWIEGGGGEWLESPAVLAAQSPQVLFLELCVRRLAPGGRLGIVLPEGIFGNRSDGYIWEWVRSQGRVFALLDCPRTTFQPGTDTKTNVLFFKKASSSTRRRPAVDPVKIAVALNCGHDRRGRTHLPNGKAYPDDFKEIAKSYLVSSEGRWRSVSLGRGAYMVPRYYAEERPQTPFEAMLTSAAATATLRELVQSGALDVRKGHEVGSEAYGTGSVPFVRTSDLTNLEISTDPTKSVAEDVYAEYAKQQRLTPGDILVVVDGRYRIGATAMLTPANYRCVVQSHLRIISVRKPEVLDPYELLFALNLPSVRLRIRDLVFVQSTLGTLGKRLFELRVPLLHGDGPWRKRIERFRTVLRERDRLLAELQATAGAEYEL
jgi:type I restriction enzyme M protein